MPMPEVEIVGAYRLDFTDDDIRRFIEDSFGDALDEVEMTEMFAAKRQELASVAAFDIRVTNADSKFSMGDFTQPNSDQAAYYEIYLTSDGRSIESDLDPNDKSNFRVYFFLHFFDSHKPLLSSYGELIIPELKPLPNYLKKLHPFAPVD